MTQPNKEHPTSPDLLGSEKAPWPNEHTLFRTYQLHIPLSQPLRLQIGRLGEFDFPAGDYVYTGSAKRNFEARIARHMRRDKALHWHFDYLLDAMEARVTTVVRAERDECEMNQTHPGVVLVPGFGASDCRNGCDSHLKYLAALPPAITEMNNRNRRFVARVVRKSAAPSAE